jgi:hypothetical protein
MTTLIFKDGGYTVVTSSWTASSKTNKGTVICYLWAEGSFGWTAHSTGVSRIEFENLDIRELTDAVAGGTFSIDLRGRQ